MYAEKDFVNTLIGLIFIVIIGIAFFALFQTQIMDIAGTVFDKVNGLFSANGLTPTP